MSSMLSDSFCFHSFNGIIMNFNRFLFLSLALGVFSRLVLSSRFLWHTATKLQPNKNFCTSIATTTYSTLTCYTVIALANKSSSISILRVFFRWFSIFPTSFKSIRMAQAQFSYISKSNRIESEWYGMIMKSGRNLIHSDCWKKATLLKVFVK